MSKVALDRVTSSFGFQAAFNNVLQQIENEFSENVLYRKNPLGEPNSMSTDIDMANNDLLNVGLVSASDFRINGVTITQSLQDALEEVAAYPAEAMGYRDEALAYRDDTQGFAASASDSATDALTYAGQAFTSASQAEGFASDAESAASTAAADILANIAPVQARGILLTGETTITLPFTYDNVNGSVSVFLNGVKQDADVALTYPTTTTIVLSEAVTETTNWEVISLILTADSTLSGYVDQAQTIVNNAALSNLPVGSLIWVTGVNAPAGFVIGDGELRSRAAFPDLWAYAQISGNISVDDASWTFGQYSPGDGSTTFRVPKVDDRFIRGKSATRPVGLVEEDAFQGHRHAVPGTPSAQLTGGGSQTVARAGDAPRTTLCFDPITDGTNGTPRTADETRPKALTMLPCIKAYDVISDPNVLNAVGVANEISRLESEKLRKDENINLGAAHTIIGNETAIDFGSTEDPIPAGVKRITVMFDGGSTNGTSPIIIQLGSGSIDTVGYVSQTFAPGSGLVTPTGFGINNGSGASYFYNSKVCIDRQRGEVWCANGSTTLTVTSTGFVMNGTKSLSGPLDRIRITTVNGTDQFDAGTINIAWEF